MKVIEKALLLLWDKWEYSTNGEWQSTGISQKNPMLEVQNVHLEANENDFDPDLPWAEDHFQERIGGEPLNPGEQYKSWPFWDNKMNNNKKFKSTGKFDHTYMERFWREKGDLNTLIDRLHRNNATRQAWFSIWDPNLDYQDGIRVPCTLGYHFQLNTTSGKLDCNYIIRSCDAVRHLRNDLYMSFRLMEYVASQVGLEPGTLHTNIFNLHCFESDLYYIKKLCADLQ